MCLGVREGGVKGKGCVIIMSLTQCTETVLARSPSAAKPGCA